MKKRKIRPPNPVAKALNNRRFKNKVVESKKVYNRKKIPSPKLIDEGIFISAF